MKYLYQRLFILIGLLALPSMADAKTLAEIFGDGVFDTSWGMTIDEVRKVHPSGNTQEVGGTTRYFIEDGRTLFGIERDKGSFIGFIFGSDRRLSSVSIGMPSGTGDFAREQNNITTAIGIEPEDAKNSAGLPIIRWNDGTGIEIGLMQTSGMFSRNVILTIEKKPVPVDTNKEALGF